MLSGNSTNSKQILQRLSDFTAETVRNAFIQHWCEYFGIPQVVISNNRGEVNNNLLEVACQQLGMDHRTTTPYSPQQMGSLSASIAL